MSTATESRGPVLGPLSGVFLVMLVIVFAVTVTGLLAAILGVMWPLTVGIFATLTLVGILVAARPRLSWRRPTIAVLIVTSMVLAGIVVVVALNARYSAEHLLSDRDPGVYVAVARWLADRGSLLIEGAVGGFADLSGIDAWSQGFYPGGPDGAVYSQFHHAVPVVMAAAYWLGGDALLLDSVAVLAGFAVLSFFVFARFVAGTFVAALAAIALLVNLVLVHHGRDAYSEPLFAIFLFGGLWLLGRAAREPGAAVSGLAGLVLGATTVVRIDAWMALAGVLAYLFIDVWRSEHRSHRLRVFTIPVVGGLVLMSALGLLDLALRSPTYLRDLSPNLTRLGIVVVAVVLVGVLVSVMRPWRWWRGRPLLRLWAANGVALGIVAGTLILFFVRPEFGIVRTSGPDETLAYLQRLNSLPEDGLRLYWEMSFRWLGWYMGPGALVLAVGGWAWSARSVVLGRHWALAPFLLAFSIPTVAFLIRPAITPDHLWAMRRFLPVAIPGLLLLAAIAAVEIVRYVRARLSTGPAAAIGAVLAVILIVPPLAGTWPLLRSQTQVGLYGVTQELCEQLPDQSAVLVTAKELRAWYIPSVRSFCGVPVAGSELPASKDQVDLAADRWTELGTSLYLIAEPSFGRPACSAEPREDVQIWYPMVERTLLRRPTDTVDLPFGYTLFAYEDLRHLGESDWEVCLG